MDKRTESSYTALFKYVNENIFKLEPSSFMTDFEVAMQKSLRHVFTEATTYSCWFHFCQALRRRVMTKDKNLAEMTRSNKNASLIFHKFLSLALLPANCIKQAFVMIKEETATLFQ